MTSQIREFTHVPNFTGYMAVAANYVANLPGKNLNILDIPAGNGLVSEFLRTQGHNVVSADINSEHPYYVNVNMESPFPFEDAAFDVVICLEGVEHVIEPYLLIREICRVLKPGGVVVLSMPNVQSLYSRLEFLFTGSFYQFDPTSSRHPRGKLLDRGHISPVTLPQLHYLFEEHDVRLVEATGDKIKRKILLPIYGVLWLVNIITTKFRLHNVKPVTNKHGEERDILGLYRHMLKTHPMMSRSLVTFWAKN